MGIRKGAFDGSLVNTERRDGLITFFISSVMNTVRIIDKPFTIEGQQHFSTGHVLQTTVGLVPIPLLAENLRNLGSRFVPIVANG